MPCIKCGAELPPDAVYCHRCGKKQIVQQRQRTKRGNGTGWVYRLPSGKYMAQVTLGYYLDDQGKRHRKTRSKVCDKKKDAVNALGTLAKQPRAREKITFKELYDRWVPTHKAGKSTIDGYKAAIKHFEAVWVYAMGDIDIEDLQECIDGCGHGRRTKENMKTVAGLMYKFGIPRKCVPDNLNLAQFLTVDGEGAAHRSSFTEEQIERIRKAVGVIPGAEEIYCLIYLGFRPSEFLALRGSDFDPERGCIIGGAKTEAGRGRIVTVSPKILPYIAARAGNDYLIADDDGNAWRLQTWTESVFYPALEMCGIPNPMVEIAGGVKRHLYTPHTCRHTFATLMKRVEAAEKDKIELIGHTSGEQLRYYQDVDLADLKAITDAI